MIVAGYLDGEATEQPTSEQLLAATLALDTAVSQLVEPGLERLDRSRPEADPAVQAAVDDDARTAAQEIARDQHREHQLVAQYAAAKARGDDIGDRRAQQVHRRIVALRLQMQALADERQRRTKARVATAAPLPSLIEQLQDAVHTPRGGGNKAASVHRSAISFEAAELLAAIARTAWARPEDDLPDRIREWRAAVVAEQNPTVLPDAALVAERWVHDARHILTPDRGFEVKVDCPACGNRYVRVPDPLGGTMIKAALQVSYATRSARCLACGYFWDSNHVNLLASTLEQDRAEHQEAG